MTVETVLITAAIPKLSAIGLDLQQLATATTTAVAVVAVAAVVVAAVVAAVAAVVESFT